MFRRGVFFFSQFLTLAWPLAIASAQVVIRSSFGRHAPAFYVSSSPDHYMAEKIF